MSKRSADYPYTKRLLDELEKLVSLINKPLDIGKIKKSILIARKYHGNQKRLTGEPYLAHPLEVALLFAYYTANRKSQYFTTDLIITAILHDTLEDTKLTAAEIKKQFGESVSVNVEGLTRNKDNFKISAAEVLDHLISQQHYDLALIKIFDRIHNLKTILVKPQEKAQKTITETIKSFVTFTMYDEDRFLENELKELCYNYLDSKNPHPSFFEEDRFFPSELCFLPLDFSSNSFILKDQFKSV